ncbi:MAG TPA: MarR family transcriptional regulator [Solirubrobacter sp.]|nr:MarR family transcriptional regulator [Solirubrobacter sp.]
METLADELDRRIAGLWHVLGRPGKNELSRSAASVLATLRDSGPRRITELAESEAITQPTVTALVGRLERDGLVERRRDPEDARAVRVHLTDEGREQLARRRAARAALLNARLSHLTDAERAALVAALPALDRMLETDR